MYLGYVAVMKFNATLRTKVVSCVEGRDENPKPVAEEKSPESAVELGEVVISEKGPWTYSPIGRRAPLAAKEGAA